MLFSFTKQRETENDNNIDSYSQLQFAVVTLLNHELPNHYGANHILYTANLKLAELKQHANFHRNRIDLYTAIGRFHQEAYEKTISQAKQLELLIDSYITLNIEQERQTINHRLTFYKQQIFDIYNELLAFKQQQSIDEELKEVFWHACKEDIMPILAHLRS